MSNMSYCMWENTANDLSDCFDGYTDYADLSKSERKACLRIAERIKQEQAWADDVIEAAEALDE